MARIPRAVACGYPHHITQRGTDHRPVFFEDRDRFIYLRLLAEAAERYGLEFSGFCLMTNHVHLIAIPQTTDSLHLTLKWVHAAYARYVHATHGGCGHLWQARYFSCILAGAHIWNALAYVELNPVRAGMVERPEQHTWSSAADHLALSPSRLPLIREAWLNDFDPSGWKQFLTQRARDADFGPVLRQATQTGRPMAPESAISRLEGALGRSLRPAKRGRKALQPERSEPATPAALSLIGN
ncbi:MAG: transposase [Desulfobacterales bacterium]|nr:transposase [Desulfobacterales bacterium]